MISQKWLDGVVESFLEGIEVDEREGIGTKVRAGEVDAVLAGVDDVDPTDVADAIWEHLPGAQERLDDERMVDLLDLVDQRWDAREVA